MLAVCYLTIFAAREAAAQPLPWTDRGYFNLNVAFETTTDEFTDNGTRPVYLEEATFSTTQAIDSGALFDFSAGARVWRNLSFGIGYHQGSTDSDATMQGSVPHPEVFNRPRTFNATVTGLERSERAVHVQVGYMIIVSDRVSAHIMAGPSFFKVRQNVPSGVDFVEGPGFTSVTATPTVTERVDSPVGFNFGVDVTYRIVQVGAASVGAGVLLRYAAAKADIQLLQNTVETDLGGFQVGLGARLRF